MAEVQLSFFDTAFFDAEAAHAHRRKQRQAETNALLIELIGPKAAKKVLDREARRAAKLDAILNRPVSPEEQTWREEMRAKILAEVMANVKPFLKAERELLGIESNATKREVKNAYRRKARKLHPDVGGDAEAFKQLYAAYRAVLKVAQE